LWYEQRKLEEAKSEALHAADVFERFGVVDNLRFCRELIRRIEEEMDKQVVPETQLVVVSRSFE